MESIEQLKREIEEDPKNIDKLHQLGRAYEAKQSHKDAGDVYAEILKLDSSDAEANFRMGTLLFLGGLYQEAYPFMHNAVNIEPENAFYWNNLGLLLYSTGEREKALPVFEAAHDLDSTLELPPICIGKIKFELNDFQGALMTASSVPQLEQNYPDVLITKVNALLAMLKVDEASLEVEKALEYFPENPDILSVAGNFAFIQDDNTQASEHFQKAFEIDEEHYESIIGTGFVNVSKNRISQASKNFKKAMGIDESRFEAYHGLATIAFAENDPESLEHWTKLGLEIQPFHADLRYYLGMHLIRNNNIDEAEKNFIDALAVNPFHYQSHFELANLYRIHLHDDRKAAGHLKKIIEIMPNARIGSIAKSMLSSL